MFQIIQCTAKCSVGKLGVTWQERLAREEGTKCGDSNDPSMVTRESHHLDISQS